MKNVMQSYKQTQVNTLGRAEVTLMLYDGAIRFLEQAQERMQARDMAAKGNLISRAIDVIQELDASLNMTQGGEFSQNLHKLYALLTKNLLIANSRVDIPMAKSVQTNLEVLRNCFAEAMQTPEAKEMLLRMGPMQQASTGSIENTKVGTSSITQRAANIKELEARTKALEAAKAKLNAATSDDEIRIAREEIIKIQRDAQNSLQEKRLAEIGIDLAAPTKPILPVSAAIASKATRAFAAVNAQAGGAPVQMPAKPAAPMSVISPLGYPENTNAPSATSLSGTSSPTGDTHLTQNSVTAATPVAKNLVAHQSGVVQAMPSMSLARKTALYGKSIGQVQTQVPPAQMAPVQKQSSPVSSPVAEKPVMPQVNTPVTPQVNPMVTANAVNSDTAPAQVQSTGNSVGLASGLMNKKMSLYKNMSNA